MKQQCVGRHVVFGLIWPGQKSMIYLNWSKYANYYITDAVALLNDLHSSSQLLRFHLLSSILLIFRRLEGHLDGLLTFEIMVLIKIAKDFSDNICKNIIVWFNQNKIHKKWYSTNKHEFTMFSYSIKISPKKIRHYIHYKNQHEILDTQSSLPMWSPLSRSNLYLQVTFSCPVTCLIRPLLLYFKATC